MGLEAPLLACAAPGASTPTCRPAGKPASVTRFGGGYLTRMRAQRKLTGRKLTLYIQRMSYRPMAWERPATLRQGRACAASGSVARPRVDETKRSERSGASESQTGTRREKSLHED